LALVPTQLAFEHDTFLALFRAHRHVTFLRNDVHHAESAHATRAARRLQPPS
jgi:hypothetical protein